MSSFLRQKVSILLSFVIFGGRQAMAAPVGFLAQANMVQPSCHGKFNDTYPEYLAYCSNFTRYCEILEISLGWGSFQAKVWNTMGCSHCPEDQWTNLSLSSAYVKNGPRYWLVDSVQRASPPTEAVNPENGDFVVRSFGSVETELIGVLDLSVSVVLAMQQQTPYLALPIHRGTIFHFGAGRQVYELRSSQGDVYVLLTISKEKDPHMNESSLLHLAERFKLLPSDWSYRCRVLGQTMRDTGVDGTAMIVNDEFLNMYMQVADGIESLYSDASCIQETSETREAYCQAQGL